MPFQREVLPELLDELPPQDPRAVRSRQDLQRVNAWMNHPRLVASVLQHYCARAPKRIVDLGGGDGTLMLRVARESPSAWTGVELTVVDRQQLISADTRAEFAWRGWSATARAVDVFDWLAESADRVDVIVANLFLHHFETERLRELLLRISRRTDLFVACDPRRFRWSAAARGLLWIIGCNEVTRHDGEISVRAGFRDGELTALWPAAGAWNIEERAAGVFTHLFVAARVSPNEGMDRPCPR